MKNKRNEMDYSKFLEFEKRQRRLIQNREDKFKKDRIKNNVEKFIEMSPKGVKNASFSKLHPETQSSLRNASFNYPYDKFNMIISSSSAYGLFVTQAVVLQLLRTGNMTPNEIRTTSLIEAYNNVNGMFQSRYWKDYFFDEKAKILIIDGASMSLSRLTHRDEEKFWRELFEFTRNGDKVVFITYNFDNEEVKHPSGAIVPILTSTEILNSNIIKRSTFIKLKSEEEETIKNEQRKS